MGGVQHHNGATPWAKRLVGAGRRRSTVLAVLTLVIVLLGGAGGPVQASDGAEVAIYRVTVQDEGEIQALLDDGYDLLEAREGDDLFVVADADQVAALEADGFSVALDRVLPDVGGEVDVATYFGGYRTVDEHDAHLRSVASSRPDLARLVDYGDSWRKINGRPGGNDLLALCLTNQQNGDCALQAAGAKPRAVVVAAVHARELATSEVVWRLVDDLVEGHGTDPDITTILDTTEVWVIPVANPDGREIVEQGGNAPYLQRKNANDSAGTCLRPPSTANHHGVDLNRNADYRWGGPGTTTNPCAQTYRGTAPASEPEQWALESLLSSLWSPRPTGPDQPMPDGATGTFISLHSYGELIFLPPGSGSLTPDDADLRALAFRMSHANRYRVGTASEILYSVSGTTDDWAYGRLGVASVTYEIGSGSGSCGGFTPPFGCVDTDIYPRNREALLYGLRVAPSPYVAPSGPSPEPPSVPDQPVSGSFTVTATFDDDAFGSAPGSVGRPGAQPVVEAEVYVGAGPWNGGTPQPMAAIDGRFDASRETATAEVTTTGLSNGRQLVHVRGRDAAGNWGPLRSAFVTVEQSPVPADGSIAGTVTRAGTGVGAVVVDRFAANEDGSRGAFVGSAVTAADGTFRFDPVEPGCWVLTFVAPAEETFVGGDRWLNRYVCVEAGQPVTDVDAELADGTDRGTLGGSVTRGGAPVAAVAVDLFAAGADGGRGPWLAQAATGADGRYRFEVDAGCYVVTFIAPDGETFNNGSRWSNRSACVSEGADVVDVDAQLAAAATSAVSGRVTRSGVGEGDVVVDLFTASADGGRGSWLGDMVTGTDGRYRFEVDAGCYVATFIAPAGSVFDTGSRWFEAPACVEAGAEETGVDAVLRP